MLLYGESAAVAFSTTVDDDSARITIAIIIIQEAASGGSAFVLPGCDRCLEFQPPRLAKRRRWQPQKPLTGTSRPRRHIVHRFLAAVPAGAAPVVPAYVPPAQVYEDDEDEVEEVMKPHRVSTQGTTLSTLGIILTVALVVTILSAVVSFYVFGLGTKSVARTAPLHDSETLAPPAPPAVHSTNATQPTTAPQALTLDGDGETSTDEQPSSPTDTA
ncbi:uncharacterized protein LOC125945047 [Dermacentor silvarum]|uniref:uncharacterized protein LOC125945047 n=1 Tax=Dermacentor silvarum TaxID=543639 RepID=UPI002100DAD4|nr:uncharacterized protein LOC125945047 [Dermacentor silvarum]